MAKKISPKKLKRVVSNKSKVKDPPRYPHIINEYENQAKREGVEMINKTLVDFTKEAVKQLKSK